MPDLRLTQCVIGFLVFFTSTYLQAGPVEFGLAEFNKAVAARGLAPISIETKITGGAKESYVIRSNEITGADPRGLMYGLLEAAEQMRRSGKVVQTQGRPVTAMRGIRQFVHNEEMEKKWYFSEEYWDTYFSMLARDRLNRFNLVFAHETNYRAPPYPFWLELPEFPEIQVPGLSADQRRKNLEMLCYISQSAADHGVDFTLGIWEHNAINTLNWGGVVNGDWNQPHAAVGITDNNIGPYSYSALRKVLQTCSAIRSVQLRVNGESGIGDAQQVSFYRDWVYRAIREAGRPVTLDVRGWAMAPQMLEAAVNTGAPLRLSVKHWAEKMGRPYQPVETFPGSSSFSYMDFLSKPRAYELYWEIWALGSHRLLLWGDPDFVRRIVPTLSLSDSIGFEVDAPLAQKGFGNNPETWDIFQSNQYVSNEGRKYWRWEFERYWMFYQLWGRLTYDPNTSRDVWESDLHQRFGAAASDVLVAYQSASRVISEILTADTEDPEQFIWNEINPGGLIAEYKDDLPFDSSFVASPAEAAHNVLHRIASAKQGPHDTAQLLDGIAAEIEAAVARASSKLGEAHKEWRGTEPDFQVLAHLARYHARKQEAAYSLSWFYETGNLDALDRAEADLTKALQIWEDLVKLTDGLYSNPMTTGPWEAGHWKDKLVYVRHDLAWIRELTRTQRKYGGYDFRYEFGAKPPQSIVPSSADGPFFNSNSVEPRFALVDPETIYSEHVGYGWYGSMSGPIPAHARTLTPYEEVRAMRAGPQLLPENVLFSGYLSVPDQAIFRVRTGPGTFEVVALSPDGAESHDTLSAHEGMVDVTFPHDRSRDISGLLLRNLTKEPETSADEHYPKSLPRPTIIHTPPSMVSSGKALKLSVKANPGNNVAGIRLHYRSLNGLEKVRTLEVPGSSASFTIPAADISSDFDFLYYFEVLNSEGGGWFQPNPLVTTPYYVVTVKKPSH
jgi:hypothetical protein